MIPTIIREDIIAKWAKFVEGVTDKNRSNLIAICLENVTGYLQALTEAADEPVGRFAKYAVPLTRRILHDLNITDLVSVQPLAQPDGKVFYLDFTYSDAQGTVTGGENVADEVDQTYTRTGMPTKGAQARRIALSLQSAGVSATAKKLAGEVYVEDEQDLMTYYGLSGEEELLKAMAFQIIREINRYIIDDLLGISNIANVNFDCTLPTSGAYSLIDPNIYRKQVYGAIVDADNAIFKARFVPSNWIVLGADSAAFLTKLNDFVADELPDKNQLNLGLYRLGTYKGRWTCYKYAFMSNAAKMLLGYKGATEFESGYVYSPYIAAYTTPPFVDPRTFKKTRGIMTRSAETLIDGKFYATVTLQNN